MSHNIGGMAPFVSMPRGRNQMYYPPCPQVEPHPHMQRAPFFPDEKMNCGMMMNEFKPPMMNTPPEPPQPPPPKKKRRTSNNNSASNLANQQQQQQTPPCIMQDLLPPPLTGYGDTIVASNPFDDTPPQPPPSSMCPPMGARHMPMMMGGPSCNMSNSPMGCGPPMSPMGPMPMMNSPHHMGPNRSPMCGPPPGMMCGPTPGSPMPPHRSPTVGSPLLNMDCIGQGSRKGSPMMSHAGMNCVSPMGSPLGNGPSCGPAGPGARNSMSSPMMDMRPLNSPMCMNNGAPPQQPPQPSQNSMQQCNMGGGDMCKPGGVGPPVGVSSGGPGGGMGGPGCPPVGPNGDRGCPSGPGGVSGGGGGGGGPPVGPPHPPHPQGMGSGGDRGGGNGPPNGPPGGGGPIGTSNGPTRQPPHPALQHQHSISMQHPPHGYPPPKPMPVSAGKIYPVDQPMVFNPQNPNAPPIYPCGVCHKEVHDNDQAILCESGCNFWFHRVCTGLTEAAYQLLTAEVYAEWVCDKCLATKSIPLVKFKP